MAGAARSAITRVGTVLLLIAATAVAAGTARANDDGVVVAGFEVDGNYYEGFANTSTATGPDGDPVDFGSSEIAGEVDTVVDPVGGADDTVFDSGSTEADPGSWADDSPAAAPGSGDIGRTYVYDRIGDAGQFVYLGMERATTTGSVRWFVELNQQPNTVNGNDVAVPDRLDGDLRVTLAHRSVNGFEMQRVERWDGSSWQQASTDAVTVAVNDSSIRLPDTPRPLVRGAFGELAVDVRALLDDGDCAFAGYSTIWLRSQAGLGADAELKDYATGEIEVAPPCGSLAWNKIDADTAAPLGAATFTVAGTAEAAGVDLTVTDNGDGDADPAAGAVLVEDLPFGTYTVTETVPPAGYELPAELAHDDIVIAPATPHAYAGLFADPQTRSALLIEKADASTGAELAGARFVVRRDDGDAIFDAGQDEVVDPPGEVVTDATGTVAVGGLPFGTYWVEETGAPTGYQAAGPTQHGPFTFDADTAGDTVTVTVENPQLRTDLSVRKLDGGAAGVSPLASATFELYLDDPADGVADAPDGDTLAGGCTTGDDGVCTVSGLGFGTYYWLETVAPPGFDVPAEPHSPMITVNAANAGAELPPTDVADPRRPGELTVLKLDATSGDPLAGATFDLVSDGSVAGSCTTGEDGTCTLSGLDFGTYHWVETAAPAGYALPDDTESEPVLLDAGNVDDDRASVEVHDPRLTSELTVLKLDATSGDPLAGATFDLVGDGSVAGSCTTGEDGTCTAGGLDFGTYHWVETAAPAGYALPDDTESGPVVVDATNAGGDITRVVFHDPRLTSRLSILKLAEDTGDVLAGAVFELYREAGDDDTLIGECITGDDGLCAVGGLDFGTYYWSETQAPQGYAIPADATSETVSITAENAGTELAPVEFVDPPATDTPPPTDEPTSTPTAPSPGEPTSEPSGTATPGAPGLPDTGLGGPARTFATVAFLLLAAGVAMRWRAQRS